MRRVGATSWIAVRRWFDLRSDQADPAAIDASIRAGVPFRGTNLWILVCATFVASIGLNVNSAAVIIGAMLISPLMGPIMGIGYGAAVNDFALMRSAANNLGVAVMFSLLTSTLYFFLTPLSGAQSEILARTSPAIWDVLIAVFGGLAGVIGNTRREKGNVIPGVAIATALMPPLCTAGYGIATLQAYFFLGALYLFTINSVFIATATLVMVRVMGLPEVTTVDETVRVRTRRLIAVFVLLTGVPSIYLAYGLVRQEVFESRAERFVKAAFAEEPGTFVVGRELSPGLIRITVVGEQVDEAARLALDRSLSAYGLEGTRLELIQSGHDEVDLATLKAQVTGDIYKDTLTALDEKTRKIAALEQELTALRSEGAAFGEVGAELRAAWPEVGHVAVGRGTVLAAEPRKDSWVVVAKVREPVKPEDEARMRAWLHVRTGSDRIDLSVLVEPPIEPEPKPKRRQR